MPSWRTLLVLATLLTTALAGCLDLGEPLGAASAIAAPQERLPATGIDVDKLTQPLFGMLPKLREYVDAYDGVKLYTEAYLPEGEGPWPAILILSPYNSHGFNADVDHEEPFREYYVKRGYAVVLADVRGTGYSEGCMDMMGAKEQRDAHDLVEWIAAQPWSDGKVGMYGVSYVGTTPSLAAIMAPEHLVTIVPVAGVTNQWRNTFQNGVPYANRHYPLTYSALVAAPPPRDYERGPAWALNAANAFCDQEEAVAAMSPGTYEKGVYDAYWHERNLTAKAKDVRASVFYVQGFADRAVNPIEIMEWFNDLDVPKKAILGQWGHSVAPREDWQVTRHAWFDYWLKGIENGIMDTPVVEVHTNTERIRVAEEWPPTDVAWRTLHLAAGALLDEAPADAAESYRAWNARGRAEPFDGGLDGSLGPGGFGILDGNGLRYASEPLAADLLVSGSVVALLEGSVDAANTYWLLSLYDVAPDGSRTEVAEGWMNAHLWKRFDESNPLTPGERYTFQFRFEPREYVFREGHRIALAIKSHDFRVFPVDEFVTTNTVHYGADASRILLPVLEDAVLHELPPGARRP